MSPLFFIYLLSSTDTVTDNDSDSNILTDPSVMSLDIVFLSSTQHPRASFRSTQTQRWGRKIHDMYLTLSLQAVMKINEDTSLSLLETVCNALTNNPNGK